MTCLYSAIGSVTYDADHRLRQLSVDGLRHAIGQFIEHYHEERPHQGLDGALIEAGEAEPRPIGPIRCRERLGGILRHYYRESA